MNKQPPEVRELPELTGFSKALENFIKARLTCSKGVWSYALEEVEESVREYARAALAQAAPGWMDIATAPKDGSWILAYSPQMPISECPTICFWDDCWMYVRETEWFDVTHWTPLPPPPIAAKEAS